MQHSIDSIAGQFQIEGKLLSAQPWGTGHINDTFLAVYDSVAGPLRVIIQRINRGVFKDPPAVMENIVRITNHIRSKLIAGHV
jgi:hypothetical protein